MFPCVNSIWKCSCLFPNKYSLRTISDRRLIDHRLSVLWLRDLIQSFPHQKSASIFVSKLKILMQDVASRREEGMSHAADIVEVDLKKEIILCKKVENDQIPHLFQIWPLSLYKMGGKEENAFSIVYLLPVKCSFKHWTMDTAAYSDK